MIKRNSKGQFVKGCASINPKGSKRPEMSGDRNGHWKGGITYRDGYRFISCHNHPFKNGRGYVREHRLVMEKHLNRYLDTKEVIHHLNGDTLDNRIKNLQLLPNKSTHTKLHTRPAGWHHSKETKQKFRTIARNRKNNHLITYCGKTQCLSAWAEEFNIDRGTLAHRIKYAKWSIEKAFTKQANSSH